MERRRHSVVGMAILMKGIKNMNRIFYTLPFLFSGFFLHGAGIDNSSLLPAYRPDSEVRMERRADGASESPDWVKSLILAEVRIDSATRKGTVRDLVPVLDHLAETGVNGIWLTPPLNGGNGYGNFGIHTISPRLTGEKMRERQWEVLKAFVDEAHKRNIRVFFDVVNWGVTKHEGGSPLRKEKPEWLGDYYPRYAGWLFNWKNKELNEWFSDWLVEWIQRTGIDGFRCDCAPFYCGYEPFRTAKEKLRKAGRKILFIAEYGSSRKNVFDFDQVSFCYKNEKGNQRVRWFTDLYLKTNIVDMICRGEELRMRDDYDREPGRERFYTLMLSCHDSPHYVVNGSPIAIGYQALFAPFIPLWYIGEEWNNPSHFFADYYWKRDKHSVPRKWNLYRNGIDWEAKEKNRDFFDQVKKMIRIRRTNPDIFEYFPDDHRKSNICKVTTDQSGLLQAYARYRNGRAVLIVPNNSGEFRRFRVTIPFRESGLKEGIAYTIRDLLTGKMVAAGMMTGFEIPVPAGALGVLEVAPQ